MVARLPVDVRRATPADVDDVLALWVAAREELVSPLRGLPALSPERLRSRLLQALGSTEHHVFVARYEGMPVGCALARRAPVLPLLDAEAVHLELLHVDSHHRRRGVAHALVSAVAAVAEHLGADQVVCAAAPTAKETHRFFARLGFAPMVTRRVATTVALRRRLGGESRRPTIEAMLTRRRRSLRPLAGVAAGDEATPTA